MKQLLSPTHPDFLRRVLLLDVVLTGATGLMLVAGASMLAPLLALPEPLLRGAGALLIPFVAFVWWLSRRPAIRRAAVWAVIAINLLWVIESMWLLVAGHVLPNALGVAFVLFQAVVVALLAGLQVLGVSRTTPATA